MKNPPHSLSLTIVLPPLFLPLPPTRLQSLSLSFSLLWIFWVLCRCRQGKVPHAGGGGVAFSQSYICNRVVTGGGRYSNHMIYSRKLRHDNTQNMYHKKCPHQKRFSTINVLLCSLFRAVNLISKLSYPPSPPSRGGGGITRNI